MVQNDKKISSSESFSAKDLEIALREVADRLVFISESDAPVEVIFFEEPSVTRANVLRKLGKAKGPIEEISFDQFFRDLETVRDWYGSEEWERA